MKILLQPNGPRDKIYDKLVSQTKEIKVNVPLTDLYKDASSEASIKKAISNNSQGTTLQQKIKFGSILNVLKEQIGTTLYGSKNKIPSDFNMPNTNLVLTACSLEAVVWYDLSTLYPQYKDTNLKISALGNNFTITGLKDGSKHNKGTNKYLQPINKYSYTDKDNSTMFNFFNKMFNNFFKNSDNIYNYTGQEQLIFDFSRKQKNRHFGILSLSFTFNLSIPHYRFIIDNKNLSHHKGDVLVVGNEVNSDKYDTKIFYDINDKKDKIKGYNYVDPWYFEEDTTYHPQIAEVRYCSRVIVDIFLDGTEEMNDIEFANYYNDNVYINSTTFQINNLDKAFSSYESYFGGDDWSAAFRFRISNDFIIKHNNEINTISYSFQKSGIIIQKNDEANSDLHIKNYLRPTKVYISINKKQYKVKQIYVGKHQIFNLGGENSG